MSTVVLNLPELESSQGQKYLTVNQSLRRIDALVNLTVFNRTQSSPPGSPSEGDRYIVGGSATGSFTGQENNVAAFIGSSWVFFTPQEGWRCYDQSANEHVTFIGSSWANDNPVLSKFSSYKSTDTSITADTWTDIGFNTIRHNDQSAFSSGTFTAPETGYYMFGVGYRFKLNSSAPDDIRVGLSINGANPTSDAQVVSGDAAITSSQSFVQMTSLLKLTATNTIKGMAFMTSNDGYVEGGYNFFWGTQIS